MIKNLLTKTSFWFWVKILFLLDRTFSCPSLTRIRTFNLHPDLTLFLSVPSCSFILFFSADPKWEFHSSNPLIAHYFALRIYFLSFLTFCVACWAFLFFCFSNFSPFPHHSSGSRLCCITSKTTRCLTSTSWWPACSSSTSSSTRSRTWTFESICNMNLPKSVSTNISSNWGIRRAKDY